VYRNCPGPNRNHSRDVEKPQHPAFPWAPNLSRLLKNHFGTLTTRHSRRSGTASEQPAGWSKRPSSAATASEEERRTLFRYVEPPCAARPKLADFFNILLGRPQHTGPMTPRRGSKPLFAPCSLRASPTQAFFTTLFRKWGPAPAQKRDSP